MREYIKKLQSKSESSRKQIFVGSLIVCMSFVGIVWISSLGYRFSKDTAVKTQDEIKPFSLFGKTISDTYSNISASVGNISSLKQKASPVDPTVQTEETVDTRKVIDLIPVETQ